MDSSSNWQNNPPIVNGSFTLGTAILLVCDPEATPLMKIVKTLPLRTMAKWHHSFRLLKLHTPQPVASEPSVLRITNCKHGEASQAGTVRKLQPYHEGPSQ